MKGLAHSRQEALVVRVRPKKQDGQWSCSGGEWEKRGKKWGWVGGGKWKKGISEWNSLMLMSFPIIPYALQAPGLKAICPLHKGRTPQQWRTWDSQILTLHQAAKELASVPGRETWQSSRHYLPSFNNLVLTSTGNSTSVGYFQVCLPTRGNMHNSTP